MAARINQKHQQSVRDRIQASQLINVLQNHALGKLKKMSPTRLKAIEVLLRKTVPDLTSMALTGGDGGPVEFKGIERRIIDPAK